MYDVINRLTFTYRPIRYHVRHQLRCTYTRFVSDDSIGSSSEGVAIATGQRRFWRENKVSKSGPGSPYIEWVFRGRYIVVLVPRMEVQCSVVRKVRDATYFLVINIWFKVYLETSCRLQWAKLLTLKFYCIFPVCNLSTKQLMKIHLFSITFIFSMTEDSAYLSSALNQNNENTW